MDLKKVLSEIEKRKDEIATKRDELREIMSDSVRTERDGWAVAH